MTDPLGPIWETYQTSTNALKVVRRCAALDDRDVDRPFRNTRFYHMGQADCEQLLSSAHARIEDQTVLALYAAFEVTLRDHLVRQSPHLARADQPDAEFGQALAELYEKYCDDARMDHVAGLFSNAAGQELIAKAGSIRVYRHWIAHGQRGETPPTVSPQFAYRALGEFLRKCGLA